MYCFILEIRAYFAYAKLSCSETWHALWIFSTSIAATTITHTQTTAYMRVTLFFTRSRVEISSEDTCATLSIYPGGDVAVNDKRARTVFEAV